MYGPAYGPASGMLPSAGRGLAAITGGGPNTPSGAGAGAGCSVGTGSTVKRLDPSGSTWSGTT
ncbi:hypothetical protein [Streptomyces sp. NPDC057877]|uniref:hypothetical protein n=1 Tax=Streptomyces sp. NPDC057877 TaxID=3346269 RepID=UPI0036C3A7F3